MKLWYLANVEKVIKLPWVIGYKKNENYRSGFTYTRNTSRLKYIIIKKGYDSLYIQKIPNTILTGDTKKPFRSSRKDSMKPHLAFFTPFEGIELPQGNMKLNKVIYLEEGLFLVKLY